MTRTRSKKEVCLSLAPLGVAAVMLSVALTGCGSDPESSLGTHGATQVAIDPSFPVSLDTSTLFLRLEGDESRTRAAMEAFRGSLFRVLVFERAVMPADCALAIALDVAPEAHTGIELFERNRGSLPPPRPTFRESGESVGPDTRVSRPHPRHEHPRVVPAANVSVPSMNFSWNDLKWYNPDGQRVTRTARSHDQYAICGYVDMNWDGEWDPTFPRHLRERTVECQPRQIQANRFRLECSMDF